MHRPARRPLSRLAGEAAARVHRRHRVARGRLRQERRLPPRPSRQRGAVALPDRRARERGHLRARVRKPRPAPLRDQARRERAGRSIASTSTSACSSAAGSGRSARCASGSARRCPSDAPLIIAGDFNDWRHKANRALVDELGVVRGVRGGEGASGAHVSRRCMPVFRLDRIYARGLSIVDARVHYAFPSGRISDHAALAATFDSAQAP